MSTGLIAADQALRRAGVKHGAILIVSDLDDSAADQPLLDAEAIRLRAEHVPVRIVPLFAAAVNKAYFSALFGSHAFVDPSAFAHGAKKRVQPVAAAMPWALLGLGIVLVLLLAGNERWNARLTVEAPA